LVTAANFEWNNPLLLVGLSATIMGCTTINAGLILARSRSMEEEFEVGYRVGYRAGRRAPQVRLLTPIRKAPHGVHEFNEAVQRGRLPQAPVRSVSGHNPAS
jgi:hypothetical protein